MSKSRGFTLIELLVVMTLIALLLTIAVPRYFGTVEKAKEDVLKQNLTLMRDALDKYYGDTGQYPEKLEDLVTHKYLRRIPEDPITGTDATWVIIAPSDTAKGAVYDVKSGAKGTTKDNIAYGEL